MDITHGHFFLFLNCQLPKQHLPYSFQSHKINQESLIKHVQLTKINDVHWTTRLLFQLEVLSYFYRQCDCFAIVVWPTLNYCYLHSYCNLEGDVMHSYETQKWYLVCLFLSLEFVGFWAQEYANRGN